MMIQYIEIFWEPITVILLTFITFYGFGWFLEKCADFLGIEDDGDLD